VNGFLGFRALAKVVSSASVALYIRRTVILAKMLTIDRWINIESLISPAIQAGKIEQKVGRRIQQTYDLNGQTIVQLNKLNDLSTNFIVEISRDQKEVNNIIQTKAQKMQQDV